MDHVYVWLLFGHSCVRWAVVVTAIVAASSAVRGLRAARAWTDRDARIARALVGALDLQVVLGMVLYFSASPLAAITRANPAAAASDPILRFFGIIHPLLALSAFVVVHASWIAVRRSDDDRTRFRRFAIGSALALALVVLLVPWPPLLHGRPLVRTLEGG